MSPRLLFASLLLACSASWADNSKDALPPADPSANKLSPQELAQGWKLLFDGTAVPGFRTAKGADPLRGGWTIDRAQLVLPKDIKHSGLVTAGDLFATVAYDNFEFRFDFRLAASGDSGVMYFARGGFGQKTMGHEFQLIDDVHNPDGLKGGNLKRTGALYGVIPRADGVFVNMAERWNEEKWNRGILIVEGNHVEHWVNDEKALEYDLGPSFQQRVLASKAKVPLGFGTKVKSGVVLLDQGEEVAFRNLKIRQIPAKPDFSSPSGAGQ